MKNKKHKVVSLRAGLTTWPSEQRFPRLSAEAQQESDELLSSRLSSVNMQQLRPQCEDTALRWLSAHTKQLFTISHRTTSNQLSVEIWVNKWFTAVQTSLWWKTGLCSVTTEQHVDRHICPQLKSDAAKYVSIYLYYDFSYDIRCCTHMLSIY